jgi:RNA polymerase sigma-70 factor (ECF subfamily)
MTVNWSWTEIVRAVLDQNPQGANELVVRAQKPLYVFCYHLTHNKQLAEDLTHDTFIKALTSMHQLQNPEVIMAWLKTIARSAFLDYLKASSQSQTHVQIEDAVSEDALKMNPRCTEEQMTAMQVLQMIPEEDRAILVLIDIQECSYEEASQVLGIPEGTVKSRLSRASDKFSSLYDGTNVQARSST